jgi:hypothetical protein
LGGGVLGNVRRDVNMFIQGGDQIDEYFEDAYRHLVSKPPRGKQRQEREQAEVIPR